MLTAQDFYAHSNWVDFADSRRPLGLDNPPGLGRTGPAAWMSLRGEVSSAASEFCTEQSAPEM